MRLTLDHARKLLDQYGLTLERGYWYRGSSKTCCPVGLLLIEKDGDVSFLDNSYRETVDRYFESNTRTSFEHVQGEQIADYLNVDKNYILGLTDGFEDNDSNINDEEYQNGVTDGHALAFYAELRDLVTEETF